MKNKNFYVVGLISFFDNDIKQFLIKAENKFEAVKKAMVEFTDDKYKKSEIDFQESEDYPKEIEALNNYLGNGDMSFSVIEVGSFL
jgi:hypothetical protein